MQYEGYYINRQNERISLIIRTENDGEDGAGVTPIGEGGLYLSADPVELESETDDALTVVRTTRATVRLLASAYMADFYGLTCRHARVNIRREDELVFAGYVKPQVLSESWDEDLVEVELDCVDALGALEYERYGGVGAAGVDFSALSRQAALRTLGDIITEAVRSVADGLDLTDETAAPVIRYDGSRLSLSMEGYSPFLFRITERLLLDSSEDDTWTRLTVVEEVLRYLDLHIVQEGLTFSVFSRENLNGAASIPWTDLWCETTPAPYDIVLRTLSASITTDEATKLELTEAYSRLELTAQTSDTDTLVESPLKEDDLKPLESGLHKYCTEYFVDLGKKKRTDGLKALVAAAMDQLPTHLENVRVTDYYVQVMRHPDWTLRSSEYGDIFKNLDWTTALNRHISAVAVCPGSALLLRLGKAQRGGDGKDNSATSVLSTETCLIIGVNGNGAEKEDEVTPSDVILQAGIPSAVYDGGSEASLSPADGDVTNYVVISGRVRLNPLCPVSERYAEFEAKVKAAAEKNGGTVEAEGDVVAGLKNVTAQNGSALRLMRYWSADRWNDRPTTDTEISLGYVPPLDELCTDLEFKYSGVGDGDDHVSRVAVLCCMLRVGDKCVVEKPQGETLGHEGAGTGDGELTDYVWRKYKTRQECADDDEYYAQSFLVGFDPKIGDKLVGTDFDLRTNFDVSAGLKVEGTAIPIRAADAVSGEVHFEILGPVNVVWDEVTRRHPTFFRHTKWGTKSVQILSRVSNIRLTDFQVSVVSDNAHRTGTETESELVYASREDSRYSQVKDDLSMRLTSALTAAEAERLGTDTHVRLSTPIDDYGQPVRIIYNTLTGEEGKPELLYLDHAWREWHAPRIEVYQTVEETANTTSNLMQHSK